MFARKGGGSGSASWTSFRFFLNMPIETAEEDHRRGEDEVAAGRSDFEVEERRILLWLWWIRNMRWEVYFHVVFLFLLLAVAELVLFTNVFAPFG